MIRRAANAANPAATAAQREFRNPFMPGAGYPPPYLAGRDDTLNAFSKHLAAATRVPKHFLVTGLRGTGKTVLLREFQRLLTQEGWLWASRELDDTVNQTDVLMGAVSTDLLRIGTSASLAMRLRRTGKTVIDILKPKDVEAWGVKYEPSYAAHQDVPARDRLVAMLHELSELTRRTHPGIALLYDEFHEVWDGRVARQSPLATFFGAIKEVQLRGCPVIVVASGLPSMVPNIVRSRSYLERDLAVNRIDHLRASDARAALTIPLRDGSVTFTRELVERIVGETRGYPYFLQHYAAFLIDSVPWRQRLDVRVFQELRPLLLGDLDQGFFGPRFQKLPQTERDLLVAISQVGESARYEQVRWARQAESAPSYSHPPGGSRPPLPNGGQGRGRLHAPPLSRLPAARRGGVVGDVG